MKAAPLIQGTQKGTRISKSVHTVHDCLRIPFYEVPTPGAEGSGRLRSAVEASLQDAGTPFGFGV